MTKPGRFGNLIASFSRLHSTSVCVVCKTWRLYWVRQPFFGLCHWLLQNVGSSQPWITDLVKSCWWFSVNREKYPNVSLFNLQRHGSKAFFFFFLVFFYQFSFFLLRASGVLQPAGESRWTWPMQECLIEEATLSRSVHPGRGQWWPNSVLPRLQPLEFKWFEGEKKKKKN